jgi:mono/diheme cytochrome c family protein
MRKVFIIALLSTAIFACSRKTVAISNEPVTKTETAKTEAPKTDAAHAALVEQGKTVYTAKCGRCHALKDATVYTATRWESILQSMAPKAKLTETETQQVNAYVMANAKK